MAGQLIRRGDRTWLVRIFIGRDAGGKRRYQNWTRRGTKAEAQKFLTAKLGERDGGTLAAPTRMTLDSYLDRWIGEAAAPRLRKRTLDDYREKLRLYVRPALGMQRLDRLTPLEIQAMVSGMRERGLSPQTIRYAHAVLSGALRQAVRWRLLSSNPAALVELPKRQPTEMATLEAGQAAKLRAALAGRPHEALFLTLLGTGLRPGEVLALRWSDLDLEAGRLTVQRTLPRRRRGEPLTFEAPKTPRSRRSVPAPPSVVAALRALRKQQAEDRLALGPAYRAELDLVFTAKHGAPVHSRNLRRTFKAALRRAGIPESIRLYDLRHTFASLALAAGAHVKVVSDRLGHASAKMTLDVYAHATAPLEDDATRRIEGALFGRGEAGA